MGDQNLPHILPLSHKARGSLACGWFSVLFSCVLDSLTLARLLIGFLSAQTLLAVHFGRLEVDRGRGGGREREERRKNGSYTAHSFN